MIIGINPAYLASKLGELEFFEKGSGRVVWDRNKPKKSEYLKISNVFLAPHSILDVVVTFEESKYTDNINKASEHIEKYHSQGKHIICGYSDHSRLVAGTNNGEYFLYDPDLDLGSTDLIDNLHGKYTLEWFYEEYKKAENKEERYKRGAQYNIYSVVKKASKS